VWGEAGVVVVVVVAVSVVVAVAKTFVAAFLVLFNFLTLVAASGFSS
jgi:hypothetical protein